MSQLVYVYGSNLNLLDLAHWAGDRCGAEARLTPIARAWLPDHRLSFGYHSRSRAGGALDVVAERGYAVPGLLCHADEATLALLDRKEGHPRFYRRTQVQVQTEQGRLVPALTWTVVPTRRAEHVPPTQDYVDLVREGYRHWGLPEKVVCDAAEGGSRNPVEGLFTYGTLRTGHCRAHLLPGPRRITRVHQGSLRDHGDYPALMLDGHDGVVTGAVGELVPEVAPEVLEHLDAVEGFEGWGRGGLFVRRLLFPGGGRPVWAYVWNGHLMGPACPGPWVGMSDPLMELFWEEASALGSGLTAASTHRDTSPVWRERWWSEGLLITDRRPPTSQPTPTVVTPHARVLADMVIRLVEAVGERDVERAVLDGVARYQAEEPDEECEDALLEAVLREVIAAAGHGRCSFHYEP